MFFSLSLSFNLWKLRSIWLSEIFFLFACWIQVSLTRKLEVKVQQNVNKTIHVQRRFRLKQKDMQVFIKFCSTIKSIHVITWFHNLCWLLLTYLTQSNVVCGIGSNCKNLNNWNIILWIEQVIFYHSMKSMVFTQIWAFRNAIFLFYLTIIINAFQDKIHTYKTNVNLGLDFELTF